VGFLVQNFPVYSETFVAELADGLVGQGCSLEILALDGRNPTPSGWPHLRRLTRRPPPWPPVPGAPGRGLDIVRQALLLASRPRYDVVHCQFATQGLAALRHRRLGTLRTAALVVHLRGHDITTFVNERGPGIYRDLFRRADLFIANCAYFRDRAVSLGCAEDKIVVIGSPVDTDRFAPPARRAPPAGRPTQLVAVGRLVEKKGFADAIAAVSHLRAVGFDVRLDILGDGPLHAPLAARVMDLGVGDVVTLHGAATQEQVIAALHGADIALTPSVRAASGDEDATVNTAKEAMATGLPVIGTFHGGIPELVIPGENGDLVPERDPSALAAAIARMLDDQTKWAALGAAGRKKVVTEYARTGIVAKTLVAYDLALRRAGARV
jgi:colanic acid/amylovoran biosynthesis glycosyltransferase